MMIANIITKAGKPRNVTKAHGNREQKRESERGRDDELNVPHIKCVRIGNI